MVRKLRGVVALCLSLCLAFLASYAVYRGFEKKNIPEPKSAVPVLPEKQKDVSPSVKLQLPPGMRAFTLLIDKLEGAPLELAQGDHVDVVAVHPMDFPNFFSSHSRMARILLQDIEVLSAQMENIPSKTRPVILLASPDQCALLSATLEVAQIRLLVRNPGDHEVIDTPAAGFSMDKGKFVMYEPPDFSVDKLLTPGMRAVRIRTDWRDGVMSRFKPGDRVDIVVSCPYGKAGRLQYKETKEAARNADKKELQDSDSGGTLYLRQTYLNSKIWRQNVKVIAVSDQFHKSDRNNPGDETATAIDDNTVPEDDGKQGDQREDDQAAKQFDGAIVVEMKPRDAELLMALYMVPSKGNLIWVMLRHPEDHEIVATDGVRIENIVDRQKLDREVDLLRGMARKSQLYYTKDGN